MFFCLIARKKLTSLLMLGWNSYEKHIFNFIPVWWGILLLFKLSVSSHVSSSLFLLVKDTLIHMRLRPVTCHLPYLLSYLLLSKPLRLSVCSLFLPWLPQILQSSLVSVSPVFTSPSFTFISRRTTFPAVTRHALCHWCVLCLRSEIRRRDGCGIWNGTVLKLFWLSLHTLALSSAWYNEWQVLQLRVE